MKTALVTGAGQRLGKAIARKLAASGYAVAIHYNSSREPAEALVDEIRDAGGVADAFGQDLSDVAKAGGLVETAVASLGAVRLLVNSASEFGPDGFRKLTPETWRESMAVNGAAPIFLMQAFFEQSGAEAPARAGGAIVNLLDVQMQAPALGYLSYYCAKAALEMATRVAALEMAPNVRVNAIAPGLVLPTGQTEEEFAERQARTPLGAGLAAEDIAEAALYLAEARHVTGHVLPVDSAMRLQGFANMGVRR